MIFFMVIKIKEIFIFHYLLQQEKIHTIKFKSFTMSLLLFHLFLLIFDLVPILTHAQKSHTSIKYHSDNRAESLLLIISDNCVCSQQTLFFHVSSHLFFLFCNYREVNLILMNLVKKFKDILFSSKPFHALDCL